MGFLARLVALLSIAVLALGPTGCRRGQARQDQEGSPPPPPAEATAEDAPRDPATLLADLETRSFPLLLWAAVAVSQEYVHEDRLDPRAQLLSATTAIGRHTPEFFARDDGAGSVEVRVRASTRTFPLDGLDDLFAAAERLETILEHTQSVLDLEEGPRHELEYAAINGLLAPLDPHTVLLTPEQHSDLGVRTRGQFAGIGAEIRAESRRILVVRVLAGGPAEAAGLQAGDLILKIDRESTINMSVVDAQQKLRGPVGEPVTVTIQRGKEALRVTIVRAVIQIEAVESAVLPGSVGYVGISTFQQDTGDKVAEAIAALAPRAAQAGGEARPLAGLVLDMRANSGGLLTQATKVVDLFVDGGELVVVRSAAGREADPATKGLALSPDVPIVVLVDEESASASEIVSGGLKQLGRAVVVGRTTFGKGTVQLLKPAAPYGRELALKLTVAEYLLSGDRSIQSLGVVPDVALYPVELSTQFPGIARMYDGERFERARERFQVSRLPSHPRATAPPPARPASHIRYLWSVDPAKGQPASDVPQMRDPEIRLARRITLGLAGDPDPDPDRERALARVVDSLALEEDDRTVASLGDLGVKWSKVPPVPSDTLALRASLVDAAIEAGEPFTVRLEIENTGSKPVGRVHVITDCVHDELDGIELLVGRVEPAQTLIRELKLQVMPWQTGFTDELRVDLHVGEPDDVPDARAVVRFDVRDEAPPELVFDYWIVDHASLAEGAPARPKTPPAPGQVPFEVFGNGDGILNPGERVLLAVRARNLGTRVAPEVRAVLRNLTGEQGLLEEGLLVLGEIGPGQTASGSFGISLNDDARVDAPFEVELIVGDAMRRVSVSDKLRFHLGRSAPALEPATTQLEVGSKTLRLYAGASGKSRMVTEVGPGTKLAAEGRIGGFWVIERGLAGRRVFLPTDAPVDSKAARRPVHELDPTGWPVAVAPPRIELDEIPRVVESDAVAVSGRARQARWVRDVVVSVEPVGPSVFETKVDYVANPNAKGPEASSLAFSTRVPLERGANRIMVVARDGDKVSRRRDVVVFRP